MPFPMKIQPIDSQTYRESIRNDSVKPVLKSRLKRLFDRPFPSVLRISSTEKPIVGEVQYSKDGGAEFEPSSVCLAKMVQNFIEESNEKQSAAKCGRNRCNCFNGNNNDSSDDEFDISSSFGESIPTASSGDSFDTLKSLIPCASVAERNLLADTSKIVDKNKICKRKDDLRKLVTDGLSVLGYDASICKSRWEKSPSYPAGEYEFIDCDCGRGEIIDRHRLQIRVRDSSINWRLQSDPPICAVHFCRQSRSSPTNRFNRIRGRETELEEERHACSSVEKSRVHQGQMALPLHQNHTTYKRRS
ncbi:hypothetical protein F0562_000403 [Nyssa sinensis]|uniref:Uncharacterized protein n=1 Tax=Nyssa sinensis TaxID=561372 RepID=A0A5J5C0H6_9ASTE|nr:hypothetical protein F0562_000403 [Nyssa sinensis]